MNITNERLRNLRDLERAASPDEQQALAQFALDVQTIAENWRKWSGLNGNDCADKLAELIGSE